MNVTRSRLLASSGRLAGVALMLLASACATPAREKTPLVYFPPPPALPRVQFLTAFSGLRDIQEQSKFDRFVVGEQRDIKLDKPYGVGMHSGKIYVCDTAMVVVFDLESKKFTTFEGSVGAGKLVQPLNISIESDGTKYITDVGRAQVVAFGPDDRYLRAYGMEQEWRPVDAVPYEDRLYVADYKNNLVRVFSKQSGELIKSIGAQGEPAERLDRPTNLAFDPEGYLYVTDFGRFQVVKFDRDGHFKAAVGKPGDNLGNFARPKGIAVDRDGHLYAVDASFNNVQVFNRDGRLLMFFSGPGLGPGELQLPAKVAIDYDNLKYFEGYAGPDFEIDYLLLVTSQFGPRQINVFGYGREKGKKYPTDAEIEELLEQRRQKALEPPAAPSPQPPPAP